MKRRAPERRTLDDELEALRAIRGQPSSQQGLDTLRQALESKQSLVVAMACEIVAQAEL